LQDLGFIPKREKKMNALYLPVAVKNTGLSLNDILPKLGNAKIKLLYYSRVSTLYRQLGVGEFLMSNDPQLLFERLYGSACAFIHFLNHAEESEKATSLASPFFDAIACGFDDGARQLAALSPTSVNSHKEYEEEFFYVRLLMDYFYLDEDEANINAMLREYKILHNQNPDIHYPLVNALINKKQKEFDEALVDCLYQRESQYSHNDDPYSNNADEAAILAHLSVEVLAWLRLAEQQGLKTDSEYFLAPGSARVRKKTAFADPDGWRTLPSFSSFA